MNTHKNLENSCRDAYVSFPMKNPFSLLRLMDATKEILIEGGKFTMFLQLQYYYISYLPKYCKITSLKYEVCFLMRNIYPELQNYNSLTIFHLNNFNLYHVVIIRNRNRVN